MRTILSASSLFLAASLLVAADPPVLRYVPKHEELKYTFGGVAPTHHIAPGTRIITWTEDCYDGAVTRPDQMPSKVAPIGHDNPQTGPFYVDGAEPGDTLAIRIEKLEPARDHGISSLFPGLRRPERDRPHGDAAAGPARARLVLRRRSGEGRRAHALVRRQAHVGGPARPVSRLPRRVAAQRGGALDDRARQLRRQHGLPRGARGQHDLPRRARAGRRSSPSATGTTRWATARSSGRRSRAR